MKYLLRQPKNSKHFFVEFLSKNFNSCLETISLPEDLKYAEVVHKKDKNDKGTYGPINLLSSISQVYERCM